MILKAMELDPVICQWKTAIFTPREVYYQDYETDME